MRTFSLADKASVSEARRLVRDELNAVGVDPSISFECLLAMTEACANALIHGTTEEAPPAELRWEVTNRRVAFTIRDFSSQPWDPPQPNPDRTHDLDNLQPGGLGIEIMRDLMDEVTIESNYEGTEVTMIKYVARVPVGA